ncbi:MAG: FAD-dependent oxidoreductase [Gammaproteobacteria bacterium]
MQYDCLIIGGGVVGCAIARELTRFRLAVALVEREAEVGFGISKANSGIIHGGHHAAPTTLKGRLEWAGNRMWDDLCAQLGFGFKRIGGLTVALDEDQLPILKKLLCQGHTKGVPGLEIWDANRTLAAEPNLTPTLVAALHAPTTGVINPYEAVFRLAEGATVNGCRVHVNCAVTGLRQVKDGWHVATTRGTFSTRFVVNAAGLFADHIAEMAGCRTFTIHPRKGEEYLLDKRLQGLVKRVIFPCPSSVSKGILVIPTFDGTIMVGPTAESVNDRADVTTTAAGADAVFAAVQRVVPGISPRDCIAEFAGLRAPADGEDFIIGPTFRRGFINVAGIQSPGLTAAPAIAAMVVEILREEGLTLSENPHFVAELPSPVRFAELDTAAQAALVRQNPGYGRIACRCELVTEAEVVDAVAHGASTLDGIKFRTRAGMGRCQGSFCTARCMELLARARGVEISAVTKKGDGSWIVLPRAAL